MISFLKMLENLESNLNSREYVTFIQPSTHSILTQKIEVYMQWKVILNGKGKSII